MTSSYTIKQLPLLAVLLLFCARLAANADSSRLDYKRIYSLALDANILPALALLPKDVSGLSADDKAFVLAFQDRFGMALEAANTKTSSSPIDSLLLLYKQYWRKSLLDTASDYDPELLTVLSAFLSRVYPPAADLTGEPASTDLIDHALKGYIASLHLYTTGFSKTGRLFDLLVWRKQQDTLYKFPLAGDTTHMPVCMMDEFITLGWEEYATLGKYHPGGWTTNVSLFCVRKAYDTRSEDFRISYLAHESRHYSDKQLFPELGSADLEYRAKLTELGLARVTLQKLIVFFIYSANYQSDNGHSVAAFCVIRDLSKALFGTAFEKDRTKWAALDRSVINHAAIRLLKDNTRALQKKGKDVTHFIK